MKIKYVLMTLLALQIMINSCDKDFEEINTNTILPSSLDPVYLFSSAECKFFGATMYYQGPLVQHELVLIGGQTEGGNRNTTNDVNSAPCFNNLYQNQIRNLIVVINTLKDNSDRTNLYNMSRILLAHYFQILVDTYGDVPYSEAGNAYISGINLPKYDDQQVIYEDLEKELKEATDALDASKDKVSGDIFFGGDIPKWKKFGNSVLLRLGMRYTKIDDAKAKAIVTIAADPARGGVMGSNSDNVIIKFNSTYTNPVNGAFNGSTRYNWHVGKPFVDFLKSNNDPRINYICALYSAPETTSGGTANTNPADQIGAPYGYTDINVVNAPDYPGKIGGAFKYSQFNRQTVARNDSWLQIVTYAQTQLLLAEARQRDYITTGTVQEYYEAGIKGHMTQVDIWSSSGAASPITTAQQDAYLLEPAIVFDPANALKQINEQYWVASFLVWPEAWANLRRSDYPQLAPINFPGESPSVAIISGGDGFSHRLPYTLREWSCNQVNVQAAADHIGGDYLGTHLFWDPKK